MTSGVAQNALELIGQTPMVRLNKLVDEGSAEVLAKLEWFNPGGSVKDRTALAMITDAEERGLLKPGATIIEPTSGNTGIGLAVVCAVKGYRCILVMPDTMSVERRSLLTAYGADVMLTPGVEGMAGCIRLAEKLVREKGYYIPRQFENDSNPQIHRQTTALEILQQVDGPIDAFIAGVGTGGTITGVGQILKEKMPGCQIIAVEPAGSPLLSGGKAGPHRLQGIGANFIPSVLDRPLLDEVIRVADDDAYAVTRQIALKEGLLAGITSGANTWAALKVAKRLGPGKRVVTIFPDSGERYFSIERLFRLRD